MELQCAAAPLAEWTAAFWWDPLRDSREVWEGINCPSPSDAQHTEHSTVPVVPRPDHFSPENAGTQDLPVPALSVLT